MSIMSDISIEIQELLVEGEAPAVIAEKLNVPIEWVEAEEEALCEFPG